MSSNFIEQSVFLKHFKSCIVKILNDKHKITGTGFFVSPGTILTCDHVLSETNFVEWEGQHFQATVEKRIVNPQYSISWPDVALLSVNFYEHESVKLGISYEVGETVYTYGFTKSYPNGDPITGVVEGKSLEPEMLKFKMGQVVSGMSGAPLLNLTTGGVCGIIKRTRGEKSDLGGRAIPISVVFEQLPLIAVNNAIWHRKNSEWEDLASLSGINGFQINEIEIPKWAIIPSYDNALEREDQLDILAATISEHNSTVIYGMSGIGKSTLVSNFLCLRVSNLAPTFWLTLNSYLTLEEVKDMLVNFFILHNELSIARSLASSELFTLSSMLGEGLKKLPAYIVFDSLNSSLNQVSRFVHDLVDWTKNNSLNGKIIVTTQTIPTNITKLDSQLNNVGLFGLQGFSIQETSLLLAKNNANIDVTTINYIHQYLGGHPLGVVMMSELLKNQSMIDLNLDDLPKTGIDGARDWLIEQVFNTLHDEEKNLVLILSIFPYPFSDTEIDQLIESNYQVSYLFRSLTRKHLVLAVKNEYFLHDSIREVAYSILSQKERWRLHGLAASYYRDELDKQYEKEGVMRYHEGEKWAFHLGNTERNKIIETNIREFLELDFGSLSALLSISQFGYPYAFGSKADNPDEALEQCEKVIQSLLDRQLIELLSDNSDEDKYTVSNLDQLGGLFLFCYCKINGLGGHLGYYDHPEPNFACLYQDLVCPWEHCIELYPILENPDNDPEIIKLSCPYFGHFCPSGEKQVAACRDEEDQYFYWVGEGNIFII